MLEQVSELLRDKKFEEALTALQDYPQDDPAVAHKQAARGTPTDTEVKPKGKT